MSIVEGGRFDFDDGGSFVGEWCDGRAHGLGIATGPENQGEFSGEWVMGFESRGVYIWPSGNIYAGGWMKGKRHGEGVQMKGKWIYKGEFTTGFCGRYGVKESLISTSKYEGSWHLNLFDGFGIETHTDGGLYAGAWAKGVRQGLGVRKSAPYIKAATHRDPSSVRAAASQNSLLSANDSDRQAFNENDSRRPIDHRSGFVLMASGVNADLTVNKEKKPSFRKALFRKLRKQKSTGDLRSTRMGGSLRSTVSSNSAASQATNHSLPDSLAVQNREITDSNVIEIYAGQWKEDKRSGHGVAERSDGLKYEGEWYNNKKDGYGVTHFPGGTKEEGRYKENVLVQALHKRNKFFALRHSRLKDSVEEAVKSATDAATDAKDRAMETATQRAQTARNSAESAEIKAKEAQMLSNHSRDVAKEFAPDFLQLGVMWLKSKNNIDGKLGSNEIFDNHWSLLDNQKYINQNYKPQQSDQLQPNLLNPSDTECLEVSGGNRRGSFRSSFRRSGDKKHNLPNINQTQPPVQQRIEHNLQHPTHQATQLHVQDNSQLSNQYQSNQYTPKETFNSPTNNRVNRLNLSPNNVDCYSLEVPNLNKEIHEKITAKTMSSQYSAEYHPQAQVLHTPKEKVYQRVASNIIKIEPKESKILYAKLQHNESVKPQYAELESATYNIESNVRHHTPSQSNNDHFEYYSTVPQNNQVNYDPYSNDISDQKEEEILDSKLTKSQQRRRSVPSIMTAKPIKSSSLLSSKYQDDIHDVVHSSEFLNSSTSVYIIENGIRKRVKAEGIPQPRQAPLSPKSSRLMGKRAIIPMNIEQHADELAPLPNNYTIESSLQLNKRMEGSLPDVSLCNEMKNKSGSLMSRHEASQLSQQRRQEILREQERQRRGEIIIRMADIKGWIKQNFAIVIILLLNFVIALGFLYILRL